MSSLAAPAVQLTPSGGEASSYFGGDPGLPIDMPWPAKHGKPLPFLASVDLESVANALSLDWLPQSGRLMFFYDVEAQPWGFDPNHRGSWAVIYAQTSPASRTSPALASPLPRRYLSYRPIETFPSDQRPEVSALNLTDEQAEALLDLSTSMYGQTPFHQIGGYPAPIQNDAMELECQLVSHGISCGGPSGYQDSRVRQLEEGAKDWKLLLQVDSDDSLEVMWGDGGILYFWIREQDARARRFENAWVILQCH